MTEEELNLLKNIDNKLTFIIQYIQTKESNQVQTSSAMNEFLMNVVANIVANK